MIIENGLVFTKECKFVPGAITIKKGIIADISFSSAGVLGTDGKEERIDAAGCYVIPGLTDIHFHGCAGHDFCDGTKEALDAITSFAYQHGVTSICPATMTLPIQRLSHILKNAAHYRRAFQSGEGSRRAELIGIHMEGPFISPHKRGAQKEAYIIRPDVRLVKDWQRDAEGLVRVMTIAPELPGAVACITECRESCGGRIHFSIGHTQADYDTAVDAFRAGADHVTHLYNAMPPFAHRAPGVIGAAYDHESCYVELICDGIHLAPSIVRAAFRLFGDDRVILVSDSMEATGMPDGRYQLGGQSVIVKGNLATLDDGTLAGSVTPLYECMKRAVSMGIPFASAVKAATINPCRSIGTDGDYGSIEIGKKAHFLLLDQKDYAIRKVVMC